MHSGVLLLLALHYTIAEAVCFGPCNGGLYETTYAVDSSLFRVECSRNYASRLRHSSCVTEMKSTWNLVTPAVNLFAEMSTAYNKGRAAAEKACEEVCASTNSCEAFGVSSDEHVAGGNWQCLVYYACPSKQYNDHLDLYERSEPMQCFAKATTRQGVFQNFMENNGLVSQTGRSLQFRLEKFFDVHLRVNGVFNNSDLAHRPYKRGTEPYCDSVDSDCVILRAGKYSVSIVLLFIIIVLFNSCIIWVSLTKGSDRKQKKILYETRGLRKSNRRPRRKQVGTSNMYF